jgi:hypothetical protein
VKAPARVAERAADPPAPRETPKAQEQGSAATSKGRLTALAALGLLALHVAMAEHSLIQENPTVDEVVHLPAGITYWQKGTFRLYHHNPPLIKMIAALPVVWAKPVMEQVYQQPSWTSPDPSPPTFSQTFARKNFGRYFELFRLGRMVMPLFSVVGGLTVFAWSRRLYGNGGGLLSLCLCVFCPNILAHARLITTDLGSTAVGAAATYLFWRYLSNPSWARAVAAGVLLGLAQLTKFSMLLLYAVWPFMWLVHLALTSPRERVFLQAARGVAHGCLIVALSILVINTGYLFEGVGIPLGRFEFASGALTRPVAAGIRHAPATKNPAFAMLWPFRENRFRDTIFARLPMPLPEHYVLGFDEQKIEADGFPNRLVRAYRALKAGDLDQARKEAASVDESVAGYSVYLNGELRDSGWWYYYLCALFYKVPEGTWLLVLLSVLVLCLRTHMRESWFDEICLATVPLVVLFAMSFLTNINLGLRYVLSIFPYVYIGVGKVVPWMEGLSGSRRAAARSFVAVCMVMTILATAQISPHYLAYFNWISGGPDRTPARLIDSNLDWGQDLVALRQWCRDHLGEEEIGLAYFGQINPSMFTLRGDPFPWFLPPVQPGTIRPMERDPSLPAPKLIGPAPRLTPGYYAVSATLVHGLPWRLYDPSPVLADAWSPAWDAQRNAFSYFQQFAPIKRIGHSIDVYKLSQADVDRVNTLLLAPATK